MLGGRIAQLFSLNADTAGRFQQVGGSVAWSGTKALQVSAKLLGSTLSMPTEIFLMQESEAPSGRSTLL